MKYVGNKKKVSSEKGLINGYLLSIKNKRTITLKLCFSLEFKDIEVGMEF